MTEVQRDNIRVLRLYGVWEPRLRTILNSAQKAGCPNLQLLERGGEYLVVFQAQMTTAGATDLLLDTWERRICAAAADCLYGVGDTSLGEAAVKALLNAGRTFTAADQETAEVLEKSMTAVPDAPSVYDFGRWKNRGKNTRWDLTKKYPGDRVQAAADRVLRAIVNADTDYAVCFCAEQEAEPAFVVYGDEISLAVQYLQPGEKASLAMLDGLRRMARDFPLTPECEALTFEPGKKTPQPLTAEQRELLHAADNTQLPEPEIRDAAIPFDPAELVPTKVREKDRTLRNLAVSTAAALAVALLAGAAGWFGLL